MLSMRAQSTVFKLPLYSRPTCQKLPCVSWANDKAVMAYGGDSLNDWYEYHYNWYHNNPEGYYENHQSDDSYVPKYNLLNASVAEIRMYLFSGEFDMDFYRSSRQLNLEEAYREITDALWPYLLGSMQPDWIQKFEREIIFNEDLKWRFCRAFFEYYILLRICPVSPDANWLFNWTICPFDAVTHVILGCEPLKPPEEPWNSRSNGAAYSVGKLDPRNEVTEKTMKRLVKGLGMAFGNRIQKEHYQNVNPEEVLVKNFDLLEYSKSSGVLLLNLLGSWTKFEKGRVIGSNAAWHINEVTARMRETWADLHYIILEKLIKERQPVIIGLYDVLKEKEVHGWRNLAFTDIIFLLDEYRKVHRLYRSPGINEKQIHMWTTARDFRMIADFLRRFKCLRPLLQLAITD